MRYMDDVERYCDLMKQGFMKPLPKARAKKAKPPIVACRDCMNWHREGKHTATPKQRRENRAKNKAADARYAAAMMLDR